MKRLAKLAVVAAAVIVTVGCSTTKEEMTHRETMYDKRVAAAKEYSPTPACQLVAEENQTITMSGVKSFTCYGNNDNRAGAIPDYVEPKSKGQQFFENSLRVVEVLVNPITNLAIHKDNNSTQRHASDNAVITNGQTLGAITQISTTGMNQIGATASEGIQVGRYPVGSTVIVPATTPVTTTPPVTP